MNMIDLTDIPPMPALDCPDWCECDHAEDWAMTTAASSRGYDIPRNDGTVIHMAPLTAEEVAASWEPLHSAALCRIALVGREVAQLDMQKGTGPNPLDAATDLYVDAQGVITAVQARAFAAALLEAADRLDAAAR